MVRKIVGQRPPQIPKFLYIIPPLKCKLSCEYDELSFFYRVVLHGRKGFADVTKAPNQFLLSSPKRVGLG